MPEPLREIAIKPFFDLYLFGRTCWCADEDKLTIFGFDIETGKTVASIKSEFPGFHASAKYVVKRKDFQVYDARGKRVGKLTPLTKDTFSEDVDALDRDGKLAVGSSQETFLVWDPKTGTIVHQSEMGYYAGTSIAPDASHLAFFTRKKNLVLVDPKKFARREIAGTSMVMGPVLTWSPDRPLVTLTVSLTTLVVDPVKGKVLEKLKTPRSYARVFVPKRDRYLMGDDKKLHILDTKTWNVIGSVPVAAHMIAISEDGERVVTCGRNAGPIQVWATNDLLGGAAAPKPKAKPKKPKGKPIRGVFFGVPKTVTRDALVDAAVNLHYILDRQPPDFAMELLLADDKRDRHWFRFLGTRGRNYALEPWIECLYEDLQVPIDVVLRAETSVRSRRFDPGPGVDVKVPDDYLDAARVDEPILVIRKGARHGKHVARGDIKDLINTVELYYPPSFISAKGKTVEKAH